MKISTPFMKSGVLYEDFKRGFGQDNPDLLVWRASSQLMNPTVLASRLEEERRKDPGRFSREYEAEFAEDLDAFLPGELVAGAVISGRVALPPIAGAGPYFVKCAIVPEDGHQNPPEDVVDVCAPQYFAHEIRLARPPTIVVFGKAPYRALLTAPGVRPSVPSGLGLSCSVAALVERTTGGVEINADGWLFRLFGSPFPLRARRRVAEILQEVARHAEVAR